MQHSNRVLWEVVPHWFGTLGWLVTVKRPDMDKHKTVERFANKDEAVAYAVSSCAFFLKAMKEESSLRIKNKWGVIQDERTYGSDPSPPNG